MTNPPAPIKRARLGPHFINHIADGLMLISLIYVCGRVLFDYHEGGNNWKQGDWLINNAAGPVRRGPFGSALISIADRIGTSPLVVVIALQIALLVVLYGAFRRLLAQGQDARGRMLLMLSPAIFVLFWVADPQGSVRKELIAFAALSLYALGAVRGHLALLWCGVVLFCISLLAHEAMVLFAPTYIAIMLIAGVHKSRPKHALISTILVSSLCLLTVVFALTNTDVADTSAICAALIERGMSDAICQGSIKWMSHDISDGGQAVLSRLSGTNLIGFLISYAAALLPLFYLIWIGPKPKRNGLILILLALPFGPLYIVAVDWGRWMSFHVFSAVVLMACAMAMKRFPIKRKPASFHLILLAALALLISPQHMIGIVWGGAVQKFAQDVW